MALLNRVWTLAFLAFMVWGCKTVRTGSPSPSPWSIHPVIDIPGLPGSIGKEPAWTMQMPAVAYKDVVTIIGVGDIMMGTNYPDPQYLPPTHVNPLSNVQHLLRQADLTFGNLEGVLLDDGGDPKECRNPDLCYLFRSPAYMAGYLVQSGFDMLSLANNHAGDFGQPGRVSTMSILDSVGIAYAGLESCPHALLELDGLTYGLVAFAPNSGTISLHDLPRARAIVQKLDSLCDIVIVSFHGGAEGKEHQHVTKKKETFYGEDRGNVYAFSRMLIDVGADVVFGHGPHVTRAVDLYRNRLIAYSLGNFCTYARFNLRGPNGIAPMLSVTTRRDGTFVKGKITAIRQKGLGIPVPDEKKAAIDVIRTLTAADFPDLSIVIDAFGNIDYLNRDF